MNSTALGAEKENINFISEAHEKFYYEKLQKVREADVYHKALCYCLGMTRIHEEMWIKFITLRLVV